MKKITFYFIAVCLFVASCTSEDPIEQTNVRNTYNERVPYTELQDTLKAYSAAFAVENVMEFPQTRGFWGRLWRFIKADARGFVCGAYYSGLNVTCATVCAAVMSVLDVFDANQAQEVQTDNEKGGDEFIKITEGPVIVPIQPLTANQDQYYDPKENTPVLSCQVTIQPFAAVTRSGAGYLHNTIISQTEQKHPGAINTDNIELLSTYMATEIKDLGYTISEEEQAECIQAVQNVHNVTKDASDAASLAILQEQYPEYSEAFEIIDDFAIHVSRYASNLEQVQEYLAGYLAIIESSNLTPEEKETLKSAIEVVANSAVLWVEQ